jgi:ApaG protein
MNEYDIRVDVETSYVDAQSNPEDDRFVFAYTITIRNEGQVAAKLLTPLGHHRRQRQGAGGAGRGVVGEQPHLEPGQGFRYSSGAVLETPVGSMQGSYQMLADDGHRFDAPIAPFSLAMPGMLH